MQMIKKLIYSKIMWNGLGIQMGQQLHIYENKLNRDFHTDKPNQKWVTDIAYVHTTPVCLILMILKDILRYSTI